MGRPQLGDRPASADALLAAWPTSGNPLAPDHLGGPFAAALHDAPSGSVTLVRGPLGRVPLYYHRSEAGVVSWSTRIGPLTGLLGHAALDRHALREVFDTRWTVGDRSIVAGVRQVLAGAAIQFDRSDTSVGRGAIVADVRFEPPDRGRLALLSDKEIEDLTDRTGEVLAGAVARGLAGADRPAVLLSGGVDSSLLAAIAMTVRRDIVALTPTWTDHPDREIERARRYAEHLGIAHEVIPLSDADITVAAPDFVRHLELPPRDYWAVALHATLGKVARRFDVVLHGEGADTVFGNSRITRIRNLARKWRWLRWLPARGLVAAPLRQRHGALKRLGDLLVTDPEQAVQRSFALPAPQELRRAAPDLFSDRLPDSVLARSWDEAEEPYARSQRFALHTSGQAHLRELTAMEDALDLRIECPFIDGDVLTLAASLPNGAKLVGEETKPLLRRLSARHYPESWAYDPKLGFPTPRSGWLTGALAPWVAQCLGPESIGRRLFGPAVEHLDPVADHEAMWTLVTLDETLRSLGTTVDTGAG